MENRIVRILFCSLLGLSMLMSCKRAMPPDSGKGDGLRRSTPEAQGVATEGIVRFLEAIEDSQLEVHSFMMLRYGKVISEAWWYPYKRDVTHIMHSMSKTATSTAIGFAVQENLLSVDDRVISFFPDDLPDKISPELDKLTIKHLLTMAAGMENLPVLTRDKPNWARTFLSTPVRHEPGTHFLYDSNASYMLSAILQKVTGETTLKYLTPRLFEPLGIENIQWESTPDGVTLGGAGLRLKTADMAKIGQFYLQKGKWNGMQLLPASWIEEATTAQIYQRPDRTAEENAGNEGAQGYGYQLWICTHGAYRADGARGQLIVVIPDKDVVIVTTANVSNIHTLLGLMWEHLYPVIFPNNLDSDENTTEMYGSRVSTLELPRPPYTPDEISPRKDLKQTYQMESNSLGIEKITFDYLPDGDCALTLTKGNDVYDFLFGWDRWRYGETNKPGPYFLNNRRTPDGLAPFTVCGYGTWTTTSDLSLRLLYMTEAQYEYYSCHFTDDAVTILATNTGQPDAAPVELKGKITL
jgi:CubicO group peptidase (beta-lactamase class C family)